MVYTTISRVMMRRGEALESTCVGWLPANTKLEVVESRGRRLKVRVFKHPDQTGWVSLAKESGELLLQLYRSQGSCIDRQVAPTPSASAVASCSASGSNTCDKCDGSHPTHQCPYFKGDRDNHKDAWQ